MEAAALYKLMVGKALPFIEFSHLVIAESDANDFTTGRMLRSPDPYIRRWAGTMAHYNHSFAALGRACRIPGPVNICADALSRQSDVSSNVLEPELSVRQSFLSGLEYMVTSVLEQDAYLDDDDVSSGPAAAVEIRSARLAQRAAAAAAAAATAAIPPDGVPSPTVPGSLEWTLTGSMKQ